MDDLTIKLTGLKALAKNHNRHLEDIRRVAYEILGVTEDEDPSGWVSDFVYDDYTSVEKLLANLPSKEKEAA